MTLLDPDWLSTALQKHWLIGVSGGRDSMALLHACHEAGIRLTISHINHQLRGEESDADEAFIVEFATTHNLPISIHRQDVGKLANEKKQSIELAAREARHAAFGQDCQEYGCHGVLLAHHADDQAETVLYNLLRGSAGLKGIAAQQAFDLFTIWRPVLQKSRDEINTYVKTYEIPYREDSSNATDFATRNRIRNEAIPLLNTILGRNVSPAINNAFRHAQEQNDFFDEMIDYGSMLDPQGRLYLPGLLDTPVIVQKSILHRYLKQQRIANISLSLIEQSISLLDINQPAKINLPKGKFLRRRAQRIFVEH